MTEKEAKALAAEFQQHHVWKALRVNHGHDAIDGWYVIVALHHHANYRVMIAEPGHAMPRRLARCQLILEARVEQQHDDPDASALLFTALDGYEGETV